jgi:hypothetical protein
MNGLAIFGLVYFGLGILVTMYVMRGKSFTEGTRWYEKILGLVFMIVLWPCRQSWRHELTGAADGPKDQLWTFTRTRERADKPNRIRPNTDGRGSNSSQHTLEAVAHNVV